MAVELALLEVFKGYPPRIVVLIISMLPFSELRGSIPIAIGFYGMKPAEAYALSVLGNLLPVLPLLLFLEPVEKKLRELHLVFDRFFTWLFARTRRRMENKIQRYGAFALMLFVATPLPVTGAWTGCAAAYVFGMKFRYSLLSIVAGVLLAGIIVLSASIGGIHLLGLI